MYHIFPMSEGDIIALRVEGYMRAEDYATLLPLIEKRIHQYGMIRILVDLKEFKGVEIWGIIKTLPYAFKYASHVEKKAIITDQKWIHRLTKLSTPFFKTEVRCFSIAHTEQAWEWVWR
jgi:hypothetical protein